MKLYRRGGGAMTSRCRYIERDIDIERNMYREKLDIACFMFIV